MSMCRVFFLLFSFSQCTFPSLQAPIAQDDENIPRSLFINYEKKALELLEMTAAPGCSVDWKEAFLKLSPIAIQNAQLAKLNADTAKRNEYIVKRNEDIAKQNAIDAGRYHFILLSRNKFVFAEDHYCNGLPADDNEFRRQIKEDSRFENISDADISCKKHAKKWLWMLVKGNSRIFTQLNDLRNNLNNDANRFVWFVSQIQGIIDIFNDDVHSPSFSLLDPKHLDIKNLGTYMSFLNPDVQNAMKIFYETEGFNVILNEKNYR